MLTPQLASAHVVITDTTHEVGTVLHINPDDDPVAGESSSIFFDVRMTALPSDPHLVNLKVINSAGESTFVPTSVDGAKVAGTYTFPSQGVYQINLIIDTGRSGTSDQPRYLSFVQSQRVSRGVISNPLDAPQYIWAEVLLILSGGALAILTVLFVSDRRRIASYSHD
jgi:hypothetical protein